MMNEKTCAHKMGEFLLGMANLKLKIKEFTITFDKCERIDHQWDFWAKTYESREAKEEKRLQALANTFLFKKKKKK